MAQLSQPVSTLHAAEDLTRAYILQLEGLALQLQYAKQLSVRSYDDGGQAHRDCAHTHGEIKPPADEKTSRDWNGHQVISGRPNEILDHFFVSSAGKLDCRDNVARVTTHEYDSGGFNRYVGARTYCDSYIGRRQRWCVVHAVTYHCDLLAAGLKALYRRSLVSGEDLGCDLIDSDTAGDRIGDCLGISGDHRDPDTKLMKFGDRFTRFGPNLIFECESSEQSALSDGIEDRLSVCCPCGCQFSNFWRHRYFGLGQQARSADYDALAFHKRLRASTSKRLEIRG